jgi:signal transduction histidine kinase
VEVEVTDDGHGAADAVHPTAEPDDGLGHGLVGIRERVAMLGGWLDAGPRAQGGFRVAARLPTRG